MANTFSLMLVIVTLVTGVVWLLEKLVFAKKTSSESSGDSSANYKWFGCGHSTESGAPAMVD